ncbi:MAG: relaxase/mobilization nuclease domain-containing protein [Phycisphaerales bacterium]|nr:relaxase/mobilization nuclease domain-containing protein [Phycisphaerales bacterium]
MVPKLHAKGTSFVGIGKYLLSAKEHERVEDRVAFVSTRRLATRDGMTACRVMAAISMDAERLKEEAGVKKTGRRSARVVQHLTMAWHPSEKDDLTQEEMERAADLAIEALGAGDRPALIVGHADTKQPHIHIVICRPSPHDGRLLDSKYEKLKLSKFAEKYERERGAIQCPNRVINNAARKRGDFVRGKKDVPRHLYELHRANDDRPGRAERHRKLSEKDRTIGRQQRRMRERQAREWAALMKKSRDRSAAIREGQKRDTLRAKQAVRDRYTSTHWLQMHHEQKAELSAFDRDEKRFLGRIKNRIRSVDLRSLIGGGEPAKTIGEAFNALTSTGARRQWLLDRHEKQEKKLLAKQRAEERAAAWPIRERSKEALREARIMFAAERSALVFRCAGEAAKMRAQWKTRGKQRLAEKPEPDASMTTDQTHRPQSLDEAKRAMEAFKKSNRKRKPRDRDQDRGRD